MRHCNTFTGKEQGNSDKEGAVGVFIDVGW